MYREASAELPVLRRRCVSSLSALSREIRTNPKRTPGQHPWNRSLATPTAAFATERTSSIVNVRMILDMCYSGRPFAAQMRVTWITDSVLCSARVECGGVPASASRECRRRFLEPQLALFPNALVAALGAKARDASEECQESPLQSQPLPPAAIAQTPRPHGRQLRTECTVATSSKGRRR
jgi:hypothetical protein